MADQNLINYIKEAQGQGITQEQIKADLLKAGWQAAMVEDGFRALESPLITPLETTAVVEKKKFSPKLVRGLIIFGSTIAILAIAFFVFKDRLFNSSVDPKSSENVEVAAQTEKLGITTPFLQFDTELKLADYKDEYESYEVIYNKERTCFAIAVRLKGEAVVNSETGYDSPLYNLIFFKDYVIGPVDLDSSAEQLIKFSEDCSTIVFKGKKKEDGKYYIYKNGTTVNTEDIQNYEEYKFDPKSKKIFYAIGNSFFIDGVKIDSYNTVSLPLDWGVNQYLDFFGDNYALKVLENNPELDAYIAENTKTKTNYGNQELQKIQENPNLSLEEKNKRSTEIMEKMSPEELTAMTDQLMSRESMLEIFRLEAEFKKTHWSTREFLVVNGKKTDFYDIVHGFHFTDSGDLRYIASKKDGDYLYHDGKLEKLFSYSSSDNIRRSFENFKSSPDGKRYSYTVLRYRAVDESFINSLDNNNESEVNKQMEENEKIKEKFQVVVDGKVSGEYSGFPIQNVIFSPDGSHVAYGVKENNNTFVYYDGKKIGPIPALTLDSNSSFSFTPDSKLFFKTRDGKESCVYIEGLKTRCHAGEIQNITFQGSSIVYVTEYGDENNRSRYNVIFNDASYGPYERVDKLVISPNNTKLLYLSKNAVFLNGEKLDDASLVSSQEDLVAFFTPDSEHVVYLNILVDGSTEIRVDNQRVRETIDAWQGVPGGYQDQSGYFSPAPDKKSVWYIMNSKDRKQLLIKNYKLGL